MSRILTTIDLDREGKHRGWLRLPHSRNDSAWGGVRVPIGSIKSGDGPTLLVTAGLHGDEYEGPIASQRLFAELEPEAISGQVIVLPMLNPAGLAAGCRLNPLDGHDPNRVFPGRPDGSLSEALAYHLTHELLPRADCVIDFHSGGASLDFLPAIITHRLADPTQQDRAVEALRAFGAPWGLLLAELDAGGTWDHAVESAGTLFLTTELRGARRVQHEAVEIASRGLGALLGHLGITEAASHRPTEHLLDVPGFEHYVAAPLSGTFEPFVELGARVEKSQKVGAIHRLAELGVPPTPVLSRASGTVLALRAIGRCEPEDTLAVLGEAWRG